MISQKGASLSLGTDIPNLPELPKARKVSGYKKWFRRKTYDKEVRRSQEVEAQMILQRQRLHAVFKIQKAWRARGLRKTFLKSTRSAIIIQRRWRRFRRRRARRKVKRKKIEAGIIRIQARTRGMLERRHQEKYFAALLIQRTFRVYLQLKRKAEYRAQRRYLRYLRRRTRAAVRIQKVWRGFFARKVTIPDYVAELKKTLEGIPVKSEQLPRIRAMKRWEQYRIEKKPVEPYQPFEESDPSSPREEEEEETGGSVPTRTEARKDGPSRIALQTMSILALDSFDEYADEVGGDDTQQQPVVKPPEAETSEAGVVEGGDEQLQTEANPADVKLADEEAGGPGGDGGEGDGHHQDSVDHEGEDQESGTRRWMESLEHEENQCEMTEEEECSDEESSCDMEPDLDLLPPLFPARPTSASTGGSGESRRRRGSAQSGESGHIRINTETWLPSEDKWEALPQHWREVDGEEGMQVDADDQGSCAVDRRAVSAPSGLAGQLTTAVSIDISNLRQRNRMKDAGNERGSLAAAEHNREDDQRANHVAIGGTSIIVTSEGSEVESAGHGPVPPRPNTCPERPKSVAGTLVIGKMVVTAKELKAADEWQFMRLKELKEDLGLLDSKKARKNWKGIEQLKEGKKVVKKALRPHSALPRVALIAKTGVPVGKGESRPSRMSQQNQSQTQRPATAPNADNATNPNTRPGSSQSAPHPRRGGGRSAKKGQEATLVAGGHKNVRPVSAHPSTKVVRTDNPNQGGGDRGAASVPVLSNVKVPPVPSTSFVFKNIHKQEIKQAKKEEKIMVMRGELDPIQMGVKIPERPTTASKCRQAMSANQFHKYSQAFPFTKPNSAAYRENPSPWKPSLRPKSAGSLHGFYGRVPKSESNGNVKHPIIRTRHVTRWDILARPLAEELVQQSQQERRDLQQVVQKHRV